MKHIPLANAELAIMDLLWRDGRMTARQIREALYPDSTKTQHGTVQKLLKRLEDKGYILRDTELPVHIFSAAVSRQAYSCSQMESLADKLTGGSFAPLITHLVEGNKITRDEIDRIRAVLDAQDREDDHD
ncbi:MAG: BlaI/MecI/CopY family transcriptional regulator [Acidobacteriota bacterium]|nr:BlaI/MecI/CopY family transcriptional regulator [Acidobacteriota bacterium]